MTSSGSNRTTSLGGLGLVLVAIVPLAAVIARWFPDAGESLSVLSSAPSQLVVDLILLASCVILSFGYRGEPDIVGSSALGRVSFLVLGSASVIQFGFFGLTRVLNLGGAPETIWIGTSVELLPIGAMAVAAIAVIRARVLGGFARWILLGVAAAQVVQLALSSVQNASQAYYTAAVLYFAAVPLLLLLSAGVSFALEGRPAGIRQRLHAIDATWRATT